MKNIYKALAAFQQEVKTVNKNSKGYGYKYASLDYIVETITPALQKNGLGFTQPIEGNGVRTILYHTESGEKIESFCEIPQNVSLKGMNQYQVLGSAITYLRRYSLESILGIVASEDNDAAGQQVQKPAPQKQKPAMTEAQFNAALNCEDLEKVNKALDAFALTVDQDLALLNHIDYLTEKTQ